MRGLPWKRTLAAILALLAPFYFPWPLAAAFVFVVALFIPWIAIPVGILYDALYYAGPGIPLGTILGVIGFGVTYFVHQFLKTRIMS